MENFRRVYKLQASQQLVKEELMVIWREVVVCFDHLHLIQARIRW
jgi:hypothetical protein